MNGAWLFACAPAFDETRDFNGARCLPLSMLVDSLFEPSNTAETR
jgi:hypothetical protein